MCLKDWRFAGPWYNGVEEGIDWKVTLEIQKVFLKEFWATQWMRSEQECLAKVFGMFQGYCQLFEFFIRLRLSFCKWKLSVVFGKSKASRR